MNPIPDLTIKKILIVEDDEGSMSLLELFLTQHNYQIIKAVDGHEALGIAMNHVRDIAIVILDWMIPSITGYELLQRFKQDPELRYIPIIVQTSLSQKNFFIEAINAGAYYFLTKPLELEVLLAVIRSALVDFERTIKYRTQLSTHHPALQLFDTISFRYKTIPEAESIVQFISRFWIQPPLALVGIEEIMTNAVEHGNLELSYEDKTTLLENGTYFQEIERMIHSEPYKGRHVYLELNRLPDEMKIYVKDQGKGFNYKKFLNLDPEHVFDLHGRGIYLAKNAFGCNFEYLNMGNEVVIKIPW